MTLDPQENSPLSDNSGAQELDGKHIRYVETYDAWSDWRDKLAEEIGFGWNDNEKMVVVEKQIFEDWVKGHLDAKGLQNKRFPHFDDLALVFGKDRASGDRAQHATDATEELARGQENQAPTNEVEIEKNNGIEEINGNGHGSQTQIPNQGASSKNLNKKRPRSNDELTETLMEIMIDFGILLQD
nr:hypothetical protein CFP56_19800 [Quercus suber]